MIKGNAAFCGMMLLVVNSSKVNGETLEECLSLAVQSASTITTIGELRTLCEQRLSKPQAEPEAEAAQAATVASGAVGNVEKRSALESYTHDNPFVLTPHRPNYLLPWVYTTHPNSAPYESRDIHLQHTEVQFQISLKILLMENVLGDNGNITLAYTAHSFSQSYNKKLSAPFRDTDHEPEIIFTLKNDWTIWGLRNSINQISFNHQSNGQSGDLSRSWNRIMLSSGFEKDNYMFAIKPWYRVPETKKRYPGDASGDDNADIEKYLGNFELLGVYHTPHSQTLSVILRNNLHTENKGATEIGYGFPIGHSKVKGYLRYFNGYGESLIDYNYHTQSIGVGVVISDWL